MTAVFTAVLLNKAGTMHKWLLMLVLVAGLTACAEEVPDSPATSSSFDVSEATIAEIHQAFLNGELSAESLTKQYIERIKAFDQSTHLNAIVIVNPEAINRARELDAEIARTGKLRPLHGIPVIVKDNYDTKGLQTTGGSVALKGVTPPDDAFQVKRLKEAGAIVLAKSNMAEWAFSPSGTISSISGLTRNPYDLSRVPAGSSGGTGASVAANFGTVGLGTDTGNSIRGPSSHNGLVGIRSTMGLTSRDGIIPLYLRNDIGGPMARTVEDAVRILDVIAGYDDADPITTKSQGEMPDSYLTSLKTDGLKGKRIGVMRYYTDEADIDPEIKALYEQALKDLTEHGAILVDPFTIDDFASLIKDNWCNTFVADVNDYLASLGDAATYPDIKAIYDAQLYSVPIQKSLEYMLKSAETPPECADLYTQPRNVAYRNTVVAAMDSAKVDALVYPTWSFPPRKIANPDDHKGDNSQHISPHTGLPTITLPMGYTRNNTLPAGLSFVGRLFAEPTLIEMTYSYEQATHHRKAPPGFGN
jgi:Asp-tRNA(Asn)/Glu-tRNA(Gln) amidotransferase A subunit family amidase